ncbi:type II toxin-antitoxin system PemK/MazF family toxin [Streptomyces sp. NPDC050704]|uniref:type II toxin-antitoxin system PemK/MazF family toxin n=1 Tax=Streptomyces sp. NPDC050704 TaxID=3157219 RepID=UPI003420CD74
MNTSWWLALAAVVLLALVASLVDGWGRGRRPPGGRGRVVRPRVAEIWWAAVPSGGGAGVEDRPCLVLAVRGRTVVVARITGEYRGRGRDGRTGVISLPPGSVGEAHGRASFLETDELRDLAVRDFRWRVGVVDPVVWDQVRYLAG